MNRSNKLTICFHPWLIFIEDTDYDSAMEQIADRGFNCIRIYDGAGILWDKDGNTRKDVLISQPFAEYTRFTTYKHIVNGKRIAVLDRLIQVCRAAKRYNIQVILSSCFYLHTNWFLEEKDSAPLFALSTAEKIHFFADELSRILDVLKEENLSDVIAFSEIFNEFDGIQFDGLNMLAISAEDALRLRDLHEKEIGRLKTLHPDQLFAVDLCNPHGRKEIVPRNIDVFNVHSYYAWPLYSVFEKDIIRPELTEPNIPEETRYFLKEELVSVAEITKKMGLVRTGKDWPRRICLYASVDESKEQELTQLLDRELKENFDHYMQRLYDNVEAIIETHQEVVPGSKIVMGEGATYCALPTLSFERDSEQFWKMLKLQMSYLHEKGFWGSVLSTTHAPERTTAWVPQKNRYVQLNKIFMDGEAAEEN